MSASSRIIILCVLTLFASCTIVRHSDPWQAAMQSADEAVTTMLLVKHTEGSQAIAELWQRANGEWLLVDTCSAYIGREGMGKTREGDKKTPIGEYTVGTAFGILPDPGTSLDYIEATPSLYGCEGPDEYYNQLVDTAVVHAQVWGEHIIDYAPDYNYGLTFSYNADCVPGLGSNVFIHCKGKKAYTAGCVALDEPFMRRLLLVADAHTIVSIH